MYFPFNQVECYFMICIYIILTCQTHARLFIFSSTHDGTIISFALAKDARAFLLLSKKNCATQIHLYILSKLIISRCYWKSLIFDEKINVHANFMRDICEDLKKQISGTLIFLLSCIGPTKQCSIISIQNSISTV